MIFNNLISWVRNSYPAIKRLIDIVVSATLLLLVSPILLIVALLVRVTSDGPVLFWSNRRGYNKTTFKMPKFRTMTTDSKVMSRELATSQDVRMTPVGNFLRKTSLDELPQLVSVLRGDMSLIGPRPLIVNDYASNYRDQHPVIYTVKPGITGLAQVNGRNFIKPKNKTRYDAFYATRACLVLDMKIFAKTFGAVLNTKLVK